MTASEDFSDFTGSALARGFRASCVRWPIAQSSKLFELVYGRALIATDRRTGHIPVFGTNGQCGWHDTPLFDGPGVVLGRKGQGPLGVEWVDTAYWVIDTAYSLRLLTGDVDLKFAYYLIKHVGLNHLKDGTSNPSLSRDTFGAQLFPLPPVSEQRRIAAILGALDDKIELNRKMSETLEQMAQAMFKSEFIDFDGHTEFQDSSLGPIPKGWRITSIDDQATIDKGLSYKSELFDGEGRPLVNLKCISRNGGFRATGLKYYTGEYRSSHVVMPGEIVVAMTDLTQKREVIGSAALVPTVPGWDACIFSLDLCRVRVRTDASITTEWLYQRLRTRSFREFALGFTNGTTVVHLKIDGVRLYTFACPPLQQITHFTQFAAPLREQVTLNDRQDSTLTELRNALLPKLISGEIRIKDAEKTVGEAT